MCKICKWDDWWRHTLNPILSQVLKGKLRSRNILPSTEVHGYSISKIVVIWWSFTLNFSKSAWKSFKITAFEQRQPPSWRLWMISRLWRSIRQGFYCDDLNLTFNTLKYGSLPRCWLEQHIQKCQGKGDLSQTTSGWQLKTTLAG